LPCRFGETSLCSSEYWTRLADGEADASFMARAASGSAPRSTGRLPSKTLRKTSLFLEKLLSPFL
jgi:hypothetical protein